MLECVAEKKPAERALKRNRIQIEEEIIDLAEEINPPKRMHPDRSQVIEIDVEEPASVGYGDIEECPTIQLMNSDMKGDPLEFFINLERLY